MEHTYIDPYVDLLMNEEIEVDVHVDPVPKKSGRMKNFSIAEDVLLVSAWLNTSKDPITGSEQQGGTFWRRIRDYFVNNGGIEVERTDASLKSRWLDINARCAKFVGCHSEIERMRQSGTTENGRMKEARELYDSIVGKRFQYEHCWDILRFERKWSDTLSNKRSKIPSDYPIEGSSPTTQQSIHVADNNESSPNIDRPLGRKASKSLAKNKCLNDNKNDALNHKHWEERVELEKAKAARHEKTIAQQERALEQHDKQLALEEKNYEFKVMNIDTTGMDQLTAAYWNSEKMSILHKKGFNF